MKIEDLKGKKIAVLGFSVEGLSTASFLNRHGFDFTILEKNDLAKLRPEAQDFLRSHGYPLITGPNHLDGLSEFDLVFRSPGIPLWNPKIVAARKAGVDFTSMTKFFFESCPCPIIGVTGTKGKGTTSSLIYEMLKASGFDAYLGGNIGRAPLDFIGELKPSSYAVLELSSFQLEDLERSPHVAVVLMVTQEHLNSRANESPNYHISVYDYLEAKKNIVRFQGERDFAVINADFSNSLGLIGEAKSRIIYFSTKRKLGDGSYVNGDDLVIHLGKNYLNLGKVEEVFLRGRHNLQNVLAASTAALLAGAKLTDICKVIKNFKGLEHRLEFVREIGGVKFYNDSFSTTPETAMAALEAFEEPKIIILGGSDKGSDFTELGRSIVSSTSLKAVILIGQMAERIKTSIISARGVSKSGRNLDMQIIENLSDMGSIVRKCYQVSSPGDVVVLSPACASFDMFKNYKERGRQFKDCVDRLSSR